MHTTQPDSGTFQQQGLDQPDWERILVCQSVMSRDLWGRPYLLAQWLHSRACAVICQHHRVREVWPGSCLLGVHPHLQDKVEQRPLSDGVRCMHKLLLSMSTCSRSMYIERIWYFWLLGLDTGKKRHGEQKAKHTAYKWEGRECKGQDKSSQARLLPN